eukprot:7481794-Alexandrium_andersonii.AAC.1
MARRARRPVEVLRQHPKGARLGCSAAGRLFCEAGRRLLEAAGRFGLPPPAPGGPGRGAQEAKVHPAGS